MNVLWAGSLSRLSTSKLFFTRMPKVDINDTPACIACCCSIYGRQVPAAALVLRLSPHPVDCSICYSSYELRLHCSLSDEWTSGMRRPHPAQVNNPSCCRLLWAPWPTERWWGALPLGRSSASSGTTTGRRSSR